MKTKIALSILCVILFSMLLTSIASNRRQSEIYARNAVYYETRIKELTSQCDVLAYKVIHGAQPQRPIVLQQTVAPDSPLSPLPFNPLPFSAPAPSPDVAEALRRIERSNEENTDRITREIRKNGVDPYYRPLYVP